MKRYTNIMHFLSHARGFAVTAMVTAIVLSVGIGKTMYANVTGSGGGHTLSIASGVVTHDEAALHAATPILHNAPLKEPRQASPFMQLSLALLLIVVGYALEVIRQEYAIHAKNHRR